MVDQLLALILSGESRQPGQFHMRKDPRMTRLIVAVSFWFSLPWAIGSPVLVHAESFMTQEEASLQPGLKVIEGQVLTVDPKARNLTIIDGTTTRIFSWDEKTRMTVARHTVKPSALLPEARVMVYFQERGEEKRARSITITPKRNRKKNSQTSTSFVKSILRHFQRY